MPSSSNRLARSTVAAAKCGLRKSCRTRLSGRLVSLRDAVACRWIAPASAIRFPKVCRSAVLPVPTRPLTTTT